MITEHSHKRKNLAELAKELNINHSLLKDCNS